TTRAPAAAGRPSSGSRWSSGARPERGQGAGLPGTAMVFHPRSFHSKPSARPLEPLVTTPFEIGVDTFGDATYGADGALKHPAEVIRDVVEEGVRADRVGLDFFGVGEHHRDDFVVSAPDVVLAAIAARTERIRLGSAVTVLS